MNSIEKVKECYVIASVDNNGNTVYLRYLLNKKWEIVRDIEVASKVADVDFATEVLKDYYYDTQCYEDQFVIVPLKITWELVKEVDTDETKALKSV